MQDTTWSFITTGENTGAFNMQFDEMLVQQIIEGGTPAVRLYQWKPWAISLGHHQDQSTIDVQQCLSSGIDIVRRPTGGRAILHAEELTYSVVMSVEREGIQHVYNKISEALVEGLRLFGVDASLQRAQPNFVEMYKSPSSIPCFGSSARYEIEWNGKKLVGSAQRRYSSASGEVVLQHGSILCGPAHRRLSEFLSTDDNHLRQSVHDDLERKTTDLQQISGKVVAVDELSDCLKKGFEHTWGISFTPNENIERTMKGAYA